MINFTQSQFSIVDVLYFSYERCGQEWDANKMYQIYSTTCGIEMLKSCATNLQFTFSGQVYWRIMGPNNPLQILEATNDISMVSGNKEVTTGSLLWNEGESGEKSFVLDLKPFSSWEVEKTFLVEIYNIQGSPSEAGSGEISISAGKTTIIVCDFVISYFICFLTKSCHKKLLIGKFFGYFND